MDLLTDIKNRGGFADFGAVGSMPLGYFADGTPMNTAQYYAAKKLVSAKKLKKGGAISNAAFPAYLTNAPRNGDLYL